MLYFLFGPQEHQGATIFRRPGTLADWKNSVPWTNIGSLGCEGKDGENPQDDIPETWGFLLADEILLAGVTESY